MEKGLERHERTEQRMHELLAIMEFTDDAIVGKTLDGIITSWNKGAERLFGYRAEEIVGHSVSKLIPEQLLGEEADILARLRRGERVEHFETVRRRKDGTVVDVSVTISPILDERGRITGASKIARDITERKRSERSLLESQTQFQRIIESAMDAIITIDEAHRVVLFNAAAERMFGCPAEEALGRPLDHFIPARLRAAHRAHIRAFAATGETSRAMGTLGDLTAIRADGREFSIEASISQIEINGAKRFTVILRDLTGRKQAEAKLAQSERQLRALTIRLQNAREEESIRIARELHDQLGRCLTTLKMDIASIGQTVSHQLAAEVVGPIRDKTTAMQVAIDEMVQVVRRISTELRPGILDDLGLPAAIEWQAREFQKRSGVSCVVRVTEEDLELSRNQATALFRIFQEILTNVARHAKAGRLWVHLYSQDETIVLEAEDDGVGISPAALEKREALGLLGMRERAAIFGGVIEISGAPAKGTTVIVRMPTQPLHHEDSDR